MKESILRVNTADPCVVMFTVEKIHVDAFIHWLTAVKKLLGRIPFDEQIEVSHQSVAHHKKFLRHLLGIIKRKEENSIVAYYCFDHKQYAKMCIQGMNRYISNQIPQGHV